MLRILHELSQKYRASAPYPKPIHAVLTTGYRWFAKPVLLTGAFYRSRWQGMRFPRGMNPAVRLDMVFGSYEKDTASLLKQHLKPGMIVLDVGAHVGYYTRLFSDLVGPTGRVYAFEANPLNFSLLLHNTCGRGNIEAIDRAVSNKRGQATFYVSSKSSSHSLFQSEFTQNEVQVEAETLDHFWRRIGSPEIDLVKIDVEGAEPSVLEGAEYLIESHDQIRLVIEYCPTNLALGRTGPVGLIRSLEKLNLSYRVIGRNGELRDEIPRLDRYELVNLFCWKGAL